MSTHGSTLKLGAIAGALLLVACARPHHRGGARAATPPPPAPRRDSALKSITPPPPDVSAQFRLSPFYTKYLDVGGLPIVASSRVSDYALREAAFVVRNMVGHRPELLAALGKAHVRLVVMARTEMTTDIPEHSDLTPKAYWDRRARGLGASAARPAVSCAEENLLELPGDPYAQENILTHELAHAIHEMALSTVDPTFDARLTAAFAHARHSGLWSGTYAAENRMEYWAEATQSWFDCNRVNDNEHGPIDTRAKLVAYDPQIASLLAEVYSNRPWRYTKISQRGSADRAHLAGFDRAQAGTFAWPDRAPPLDGAAPSAVPLPALPRLAPLSIPAASPRSNEPTAVVFWNHRSREVSLAWVDFDGARKHYATLAPGAKHVQQTYVGHVWVVSEREATVGAFVAGRQEARADIE